MLSLEAKKVLLKSQKIEIKTGLPRRAKALGNKKTFLVYPLSLKINGSGEILNELNPKTPLFVTTSLLNQGDTISGKNLWGFSCKALRPDSIKVGGEARSSAHPRQSLRLDGEKCFLSVVEDFSGSNSGTHPQDILIE